MPVKWGCGWNIIWTENNGGEMFIFWSGLKWRLKKRGMKGDESERGVFNCVEVVITARRFPYKLEMWTAWISLLLPPPTPLTLLLL